MFVRSTVVAATTGERCDQKPSNPCPRCHHRWRHHGRRPCLPLGHEGWGDDTVLLEKAELTSGSTWHAAGQITHSTSSFGLGKCVDYNIGLYSGGLERETGQPVTWHGCGSFRLAYTEDEMDWLRHTLSVGRSLGFNIELVGPNDIAKLHPFYNLDGVLGALHTPDDGHVDPTNVTQAMATGARQKGVQIIRSAAPPTSLNCLPENGRSKPKKAQSPANMWSTQAEPMRAKWANGRGYSCQ